jgi:hypothetical protein
MTSNMQVELTAGMSAPPSEQPKDSAETRYGLKRKRSRADFDKSSLARSAQPSDQSLDALVLITCHAHLDPSVERQDIARSYFGTYNKLETPHNDKPVYCKNTDSMTRYCSYNSRKSKWIFGNEIGGDRGLFATAGDGDSPVGEWSSDYPLSIEGTDPGGIKLLLHPRHRLFFVLQ